MFGFVSLLCFKTEYVNMFKVFSVCGSALERGCGERGRMIVANVETPGCLSQEFPVKCML